MHTEHATSTGSCSARSTAALRSVRRRPAPGRVRAGFAAILTLGALGLAACGGGSEDALVVYSGRSRELINPLLERFAEETGIDIEVSYKGDSTNLALVIDQEGDKSPADVFISQSPGAIGYLDAKDRLVAIPESVLEAVPEEFRATDGQWVGTSGRVRVLVYDTAVHDEADLPDSVFDLTEPEYAGKVGIAPTNASFQDFVSAMRLQRGDEETRAWLEGMEANDAQIYPDNLSIVAAVGRGEIEYGLVNHYYNEQVRAEDPDATTANHYMTGADEPGGIVLVAAVGVLDTAGDQEEHARELVRFLLSEEAQEYFATETLEYPLAKGVEPAADLPALDALAAPPLDLARLGADFAATREMIRDAGLESG